MAKTKSAKLPAIAGTKTKSPLVAVTFRIEWDHRGVPKGQQREIWDGIGRLLAMAIPPERREQFLRDLRAEFDRAPEANSGPEANS